MINYYESIKNNYQINLETLRDYINHPRKSNVNKIESFLSTVLSDNTASVEIVPISIKLETDKDTDIFITIINTDTSDIIGKIIMIDDKIYTDSLFDMYTPLLMREFSDILHCCNLQEICQLVNSDDYINDKDSDKNFN